MSMTASHHDLDLDALEILSGGAHTVAASAVTTCQAISGAVALATCNRFELYLDIDGTLTDLAAEHAAREIAGLVATASGVTLDEAVAAFTVRRADDVVAHLFDVASGLDSMVLGEREIAGQVRRSLATAHAEGTTSASLERLFQTASRASKAVAARTHLGADGRSVVSVALDLAEPSVPAWRAARAVIVGTGAYAGASVAALRARGCTDVRVWSASGRAAEFAASHDVMAVDDLVGALADADLVVSCSGTARRGPVATTDGDIAYLVHAAAVVQARSRATARAGDDAGSHGLVVLDLALHHDVEPAVGDVDDVLLLDLAAVRANAPTETAERVSSAREIVAGSVARFTVQESERSADGVIVRLRERVEAELDAELARSAGSFSTDADRAAHERSLRRFSGALLHRAISRVRESVRSGVDARTIDPDSVLEQLAG
ncbi:glutamyl-tRNA reductase [Sediminihabitans luteus]|uniref:Glutamyl-tRNA reductase n=1 Tax=Sediminihabitans luteus TaxID=1138585 RepID=A0A2M9D0R7_9CELL|nr:glutamyl-tRNA reductase [Sediminihabitans luteus]PJJ77750.1 glutamyl-tRNA reductase [Sediminihabitans luteus]